MSEIITTSEVTTTKVAYVFEVESNMLYVHVERTDGKDFKINISDILDLSSIIALHENDINNKILTLTD